MISGLFRISKFRFGQGPVRYRAESLDKLTLSFNRHDLFITQINNHLSIDQLT